MLRCWTWKSLRVFAKYVEEQQKGFQNMIYCVCVKGITLYRCLCSSAYCCCFSASHVRDFGIVNCYSWARKSLDMADRGGHFSFFSRYSCKNWYLHFHKTCDHQIWQAGTSRGVDSNDTNSAGAGDVSTPWSRDKLKAYLHYQSSHSHQTWHNGSLPWWTFAHKVTWLFHHIVLQDKLKPLNLHFHSAYGHQTWQDGD